MAPVASENNGVQGWGELGRCDPISSGFARPSLCVFLTPGQSVGCIALGCFTASLGLRAPGHLRDSSRGGCTGAESLERWGGAALGQGSGLTPLLLCPEGSAAPAFCRDGRSPVSDGLPEDLSSCCSCLL